MRSSGARRWFNVWSRKLHRWGSVATMLPFLVVIATGILLLLKKEFHWIQPSTAEGPFGPPSIGFDRILAATMAVPEAAVFSWDDIDRLDIRPEDAIAKVHCKNGYEVQVSTVSGEPLQVAYRRSDLIESIHDGSFFHERAKLWVFLPNAVILFMLWLTGLWLWLMPHLHPRRRGGEPPADPHQ